MIRFDRVTFRYGTQQETSSILEEVSFSLGSGESAFLLGRNGSGKSTLALLAAGLLRPVSGEVLVNGVSAHRGASRNVQCVGLAFQNPDTQIFGTTVEEDIVFGLENLGLERAEMEVRMVRILDWFHLTPFRQAPVFHLSGGQRQKLALASVLVMQPEFLILDEPTSQLDPWSREEFWGLLERLKEEFGLGLLVVSQRSEESERMKRSLVLHEGKLVYDGSSEKLWESQDVAGWGITPPESAILQDLLRVS